MVRRDPLRALLCLMLIAGLCSVHGADGPPTEYQVKAVFLYNFLKFVEWPDQNDSEPWIIGVLGHDPFGEFLEATVDGKPVKGRPIIIRHVALLADASRCHILFVPREFDHLKIVPQAGMLTVGESAHFLDDGGIINFYTDGNRVRFEIRPEAAHANGLRVSAQLLRLARVR